MVVLNMFIIPGFSCVSLQSRGIVPHGIPQIIIHYRIIEDLKQKPYSAYIPLVIWQSSWPNKNGFPMFSLPCPHGFPWFSPSFQRFSPVFHGFPQSWFSPGFPMVFPNGFPQRFQRWTTNDPSSARMAISDARSKAPSSAASSKAAWGSGELGMEVSMLHQKWLVYNGNRYYIYIYVWIWIWIGNGNHISLYIWEFAIHVGNGKLLYLTLLSCITKLLLLLFDIIIGHLGIWFLLC